MCEVLEIAICFRYLFATCRSAGCAKEYTDIRHLEYSRTAIGHVPLQTCKPNNSCNELAAIENH